MLKKLEITSADQTKVLANPLRLSILSLFDDRVPRTSKQLADLLDMAPAKVHYHVRELLRAGILELIETREKGGVIEKYYLPVAEQFHIKLDETGLSIEEQASTRHQFLKSVLDEFRNSFLTAAEICDRNKAEKTKEQGEAADNELRIPTINKTHLLLTDDDAKQLVEELRELFERWAEIGRERQSNESNSVKSYGMLLSIYEKPTKSQKGFKRMTVD